MTIRTVAALGDRPLGPWSNAADLDFRNTVRGFRALGLETVEFHRGETDPARFRALRDGRFDLVYWGGAPSAMPVGDGGGGPDIIECLRAPLILRLADPPFREKFYRYIEALPGHATISAKDMFLPDYLARSDHANRHCGYCPGRYDPADFPGDQDRRPLSERRIPFLCAVSVGPDPARLEGRVAQDMPNHLTVLRDLARVLETAATRPAWRLAEDVYRTTAPDLSPYRGCGRILLDTAVRLAFARARRRLVAVLARHDGLLILGGDTEGLRLAGGQRARITGPRPIGEVIAALGETRVSVTMSPHHAVGALSERVYLSMAAGALTLAPATPAMDRHFTAGRHYLDHRADHADLAERLDWAVAGTGVQQSIADAGFHAVSSDFSHVRATERMLSDWSAARRG